MFLKNKNIIFKIRRSKVTDYAALNGVLLAYWLHVISFWPPLEKTCLKFQPDIDAHCKLVCLATETSLNNEFLPISS